MRNRLVRKSAAVALVLCLLACSACGPPKRERLVKVAGYGQQLSALLQANWTLPYDLYHAGVITEGRYNELVTQFEAARVSLEAFNNGLRRALAEESPDYAALVPLVADIIGSVQRINVNVNSDKWRRTLAAIELSLRAVANFFALQVREARAAGYTDRELGRFVDLRALRVVELYAVKNRHG